MLDEMIDQDHKDLGAFVLGSGKSLEHRVVMLTEDASLGVHFVVVVVADLDPVGEFERTQREPPPEGASHVGRIVG